jgi:glutamate carboxypeptidase
MTILGRTFAAVALLFPVLVLLLTQPISTNAADPPTDPKALLQQASRLTQPFLDQVKELVNIDSGTGYAKGITEVEAILQRHLRELGAKVDLIPVTVGAGNNIVAAWEGSGKGRVLVLVHSDTVFKEGTAAERPFRIEGNRAYGPGVLDDKGGIVLAVQAVRLLQQNNFRDFGKLTLLINPDEERGSFGSRDLIRKVAKEHDYALALEFGSPGEDKVTNWRKGIGYFKLEVKGKAAHAGAEPEKGCNAAMEMAHQALQLSKLGNKEKETTINFTIVQSGDRPNIIPESARAQADVRVLYPEEFDRLESDFKRLSQDKLLPCATVTPIVERGRPPFPANPGTEQLVKKAQSIYKEIGLDLGVEGSGGGTDGNYTASVGTPTLDALGPVGGGAHGADEYIDIDRLAPRIYLLARLIMDLGAGK